MRKIILTGEQNERIKLESKNGDSEYKALTLDCHINGWSAPLNQCLRSLSVSDMARILYEPNSYEVVPKFKVGDSIVHNKGAFKGVKFVTHLNARGYVFVDDVCDVWYSPLNVRHSTKEEAFWDELGREVAEFKAGDVTITINDSPFFLENEEDVLAEKDEYNNGRLKGFYPAASFIKIPL